MTNFTTADFSTNDILRRTRLITCLLSLLATACVPSEQHNQQQKHTGAVFEGQDLEAAESMEALAKAKRIREAHPGRDVYLRTCATCHEQGVAKAPHTGMIGMMTPEAVLRSMNSGLMQTESQSLTKTERLQVAEYLAGSELGEPQPEPAPQCKGEAAAFDHTSLPVFNNWGLDLKNTRMIPASAQPLSAKDFSQLELKWAFAVPGANRIRSQPALLGGALYFGGHDARVYALDAQTGCLRWTFEASGEVRTGITTEAFPNADKFRADDPQLFFGDVIGNVYSISAVTGKLNWRHRPDGHPNATITGTPSYYDGLLLVSISALETGPPTNPAYECCKFRGSVVAYNASNGKVKWQSYAVFDPPTAKGINRSGTQQYGPSGAAVWNAPAVDVTRRQVYFGTAENLSSPATKTSDAIFAVDLDTGLVRWTFQGTPNDAWNGACGTVQDDNCPEENGPDYDMAAGIILAQLSDGRDLVIGGQKSGVVHALNPKNGRVVWQNPVGRGGVQGGIHFGMAAAGDTLYVPVTDMPDGREYSEPARPGLYALDMKTGDVIWKQPAPTDICKGRDFCHPGISQAITAAPGIVMAGAMDGILRVHDEKTGKLIWHYDTTQPVTSLAGQQTSGGSMGGGSGPISVNGMLFISSGYGLYFHMPGNALLAFGKPAMGSE